ncbi:mechanosensitive ion channel family protein [Halorubrum gandharaense]
MSPIDLLTTEARVAITLALTLAAILLGAYLIPKGMNTLGRVIKTELLGSEKVPYDPKRVSWFVPRTLAIRVLQGVVVIHFALALLTIWGFVATAQFLFDWLVELLPTFMQVVVTVLLVAVVMVASDVIEHRIHDYAEESERIDEHEEGVVLRTLQAGLILFGGVVVLTLWNFDFQGLLVAGGFAGIVLGMAAQHTLGNMIAGFVLMFARPFEIGDWVLVDGMEGTVTDITIMHTRIRTFDGETVVFPNQLVNKQRVKNYSDRSRLRLTVAVSIDYDADLAHAESVAVDRIEAVEDVLEVPSPEVASTDFGDSGITIELRFWIENPSARKRRRVISQVVSTIKAGFEAEGIAIPYPHRTLDHRDGGFDVDLDGRSDAGDG